MFKKEHAIGVFDSGLGGLTVVRALRRQLPQEDIVYFGDTARVPYGTKSADAIVRFSKENVDFLVRQKVKLIVVACHSSSSFAIPILRKMFSLPILEVIQPAVKRAVEVTRNQKIGVIATSATIQSKKYQREIAAFTSKVKVVSQACPLLVPLVEEGSVKQKIVRDIVEEYLRRVKKKNVDTLILGCTHYPILKPVITDVVGKKIMLIDSADEVASEVEQVLEEKNLFSLHRRQGRCRVFVSDQPQHFQMLARRFLGYKIPQIRKV